VECSLTGPYVMVTSVETSDGGRAGVVSEVGREVAAMLIVGGKAAIASQPEIDSYRVSQEEARAAHEKAEMAKHLQVTIISDTDGKVTTRKSPGK
jgi:hypothetical protein